MNKLIGASLLGLAAVLIGCDSANNTESDAQATQVPASSAAPEAASVTTFEKAARFTSFRYEGESQEKVTG